MHNPLKRKFFAPTTVECRIKHHVRNLLFSGIVLAAILCVASMAGAFNEAVVVKTLLKKSNAKKAVDEFQIITVNLFLEMELRIESPDKMSEIAAAREVWQTSLKQAQSSFDPNILNTVIQCINLFEGATERGEILYTYVYLLSTMTSLLFWMLQETFSGRAQNTVNSLVLHSVQAAFGSLFSRMIYFVSKPWNYPFPYQGGDGLLMQYITSLIAPYYSAFTVPFLESYRSTLSYAYYIYLDTSSFVPTSSTITLLHLDSLSVYTQTLDNISNAEITADKGELEPLYCFIAGFVLIFVALVLCCIVFCCYCTRSKQARSLASTFENTTKKNQLLKKYIPLLKNLRAVGDAKHRSNEVNRVYSIAACWMDVLRTLTPQLLFGAYPDHSRDWSLLEQEVHLSVGKTRVCRRVVVMEVSISVHADVQRPFYERELSEQLELLNELYRIVVSETNAAGGVVLGLRGNVSVLCAWNTTKVSRQSPLLALRAAHCMQYRLKDVGGMPRVLIAMTSGPVRAHTLCMNTRHLACIVAGKQSVTLSAMRLAGLALGLTVTVDRNTARHLPRRVTRQLRPMLVMRLRTWAGHENVEMYSSTMEGIDDYLLGEEYIKCFSLYQNNLLNESLVAFEHYLEKYPADSEARWVFEFVVKPKFQLSLIEGSKKIFSPMSGAGNHCLGL